RITPDTIRFLINNDASKGPKGGFSIGGFDRNKGLVDDFMNLTSNSSLSGLYNTFLGYQVGLANTSTGNYNSSIGYQAGMSSTTADNNVFLGFQAGKYLTTGNSNVFLGTDAGGTSNGYDNVYIGRNAGRYESGFYNVYIGYGSGSREAPVPPFIPTNYSYNTAVGYMAGHNNTSQGLVAVGWHAGLQNSGDLNVFVGAECGQGNREGTRNTFLGMEAGWLNNSGSNNVFVGTEAGRDNNSGSGNIFIGNTAGATQNVDDRLFIDNSSITNPLIYGNFSSNVVRINGNLEYTGTLNHVSDLKLKTNLISIENVLSKIQGISGYYFDWNNEAKENLIVNDKKQIGVIAQELEVEFPELVSVNEEGYKTVDYANLTPILLQAIKEQQSEIEDLKEQMMQLQEMVGAMYGVWSKE
ncbi:MAG: tail fiber domain-containing protein, partial [Bacteroidales bacterium]|nr:tail fiber domain-containing protein [Bacteroidales bacterium]